MSGYHAPTNPYDANGLWGQCTWFAWGRFYELYGYDPGFRGSGKDCAQQLYDAHSDEFELSEDEPKAGAVFSCGGGGNAQSYEHGHVGVVIYYDGNTIITDEGNVSGSDWKRITYTVESFHQAYPNDLVFANPKSSPSIETIDTSDIGTLYYIKVATWSETQVSFESNDPEATPSMIGPIYEMSATKVNYYDMVKSYTMPFNYLWTLLVVSEAREFVMDLADLVYDSEITLTINDCETVTTTEIVNTYDKDTKADTNAVVSIHYKKDGSTYSDSTMGSKTGKVATNNYKTVETIVTTTNTIEAALTKADVWIVDYTRDFKYQTPETTQTGPNSVELENIDYQDSGEDDNDPLNCAEGLLGNLRRKHSEDDIVGENIIKTHTKYQTNTYNRRKTNTTITERTKYVGEVGEVREKVKKVKKKDKTKRTEFKYKEKNFVTLFLSNLDAQNKILDGADWIFEFLTLNDNTKDMVDLTKYLLYKATGSDEFGITEFDFSIFNPENVKEVSDSGATGELGITKELEEFIGAFEGGVSPEYRSGNDYLIYYTSVDGCLNIGAGVVVKFGNGSIPHPEYVPNPVAGDIVSEETYLAIRKKVFASFSGAVEAAAAKYGVTLEQHQKDALISFVYNAGPARAEPAIAAYKNGGNDGLWAYMSQIVNSSTGLYLPGLERRRREEFELFTTGDYTIS